MSNKKRYIIVLVLLLFIGLGIFTFAAPSGDPSEGNGSTLNNVAVNPDDNTTSDNDTVTNTTTNTTVNNSTNNGNGQNNNVTTDNNGASEETGTNDEPALSDAYKAALAAVEKAEGSLEDEDYKTAMGMVTDLTEEDTQDLEDRLAAVNGSIVAALVEELKNQTNDALAEEDAKALDSARGYREDNDIIARVEALDNDLEDTLKYILDNLAKVLNDTTGPEFNIEDGALLNSITAIEVEDAEGNEIISLILVDEEGNEIELTEETEVKDGTYTLVATDAALNDSTVTFTLDATAAERESSNMYANGYLHEYKVDNKTYKDYYVNDDNTVTAYIRVNEQLKEVPTFTFHINGKDYVAENVVEKFHNETDEANGVYKYQTTILVADLQSSESGEIDFTVSNIVDLAGNKTDNIEGVSNLNSVYLDKDAAEVDSLRILAHNSVMGDGYVRYTNNGDRVLVYLTLNEKVEDVTATINGVAMNVFSDTYNEEEGTHSFTFEYYLTEGDGLADGMAAFEFKGHDMVGNPFTYTEADGTLGSQKWIYIDRTAPAVNSLRILAHNAKMGDGYVRYVNNGDRVLVYLTLNEKVYDVTATINGVAMNVFSDKYNEEEGTHSFTFEYYLTEGDGLVDGMAAFEFKGHDIAGNDFTYTEENGTLGSQKWIYIDRTAPAVNSLKILAHNSVMGDGYVRYVNNGDRVLVYLTLNEKVYDAAATINGVAMNVFNDTYNEEEGTHSFTFEYYLTEGDGLEDGLANFTFKGTDFTGNSFTYTEADGTLGSQKWIYIDRTAPVASAVRMVTSRGVSTDGTKTWYATNGDLIYVYAEFTEKLGTSPVLSINDGVVTMNFDNGTYIEESGLYIYSAVYEVKENDGLVDGLITIDVTGYADVTGNVGEDLDESYIELNSQKRVVIDKTGPEAYSASAIGNKAVRENGENNWYVTDGNNLQVYARFTEELKDLPVLYINGKEIATLSTKTEVEGGYSYSVWYKVDSKADGLEDGTFTIEIKGYTDFLGNVGKTITKEDMTKGQRVITLDTKGPEVVTFAYYGGTSVQENGENNWYIKDGNTLYANLVLKEKSKDAPVLVVNDKTVATFSYIKENDGKVYYSTSYVMGSNDEFADGLLNVQVVGYNDFLGNVGEQPTKSQLLKGQRVVTHYSGAPENVNNTVTLDENIILLDEPFYNDITATEDVTIDGQGHTVEQRISSADKMYWLGNNNGSVSTAFTSLSDVFSSYNGANLTIKNIKFTGSVPTMFLGNYEDTSSNWFNTQLDNVVIDGIKVIKGYAGYNPAVVDPISPAVAVYGTATINNSKIINTTRSSLSTNDEKAFKVYDLAIVNNSMTTLNNSEVGSIYTWAKAGLVVNNSKIDTIYTAANKVNGGIVINSGSTVNNIIAHADYNLKIYVNAGAVVDTVDLSFMTNAADRLDSILFIEEGATVKNIITE